jgi:hypothetical protein
MSYRVSLDFSDMFSIKSGEGRGAGGSNVSSQAFGDSFAGRPKANMESLLKYRHGVSKVKSQSQQPFLTMTVSDITET